MRAMDGSHDTRSAERIRWTRDAELRHSKGGTGTALWLLAAMLLLVAAIMAATSMTARADTTVSLPAGITVTTNTPAVTLNDATVLGPTTARVDATIDPHVQGTVRVFYGTDGVLNLSTPPITLPATTEP